MATSPIRVSPETDQKISYASSLMGKSKKAFLEDAVTAYCASAEVEDALARGMRDVADLFELPIVVSASSMERVMELDRSPRRATDDLRALKDL